MRLDRTWIGAHIPHQGSMCLLAEVLSWDAQQLLGRAESHRDASHPLRAHGRLGSVCAIEYAAQAVAVHGALLQPSSQPLNAGTHSGMLASARSVELAVARLDDISGDLLISVQRLHGNAYSALYDFAVSERLDAQTGAAPPLLAQGRLSLWLRAA